MDKIFEWISENKEKAIGILVFIILGLTVGVPIIIHIMYNIIAPVYWMEAPWEAGNALEYYGATLSFVGTIVFSGLAVYQTHVIKEESDAREQIMQKLEERRLNPVFYGKMNGCSGKNININVSITNQSNNIAHKLQVSNFEVTNSLGQILACSNMVDCNRSVLHEKEDAIIKFTNPELMIADVNFKFRFSCINQSGKILNYQAKTFISDPKELMNHHLEIEELE